ncbi:hypothetical protein D3C83_71240 [compost metagenome]
MITMNGSSPLVSRRSVSPFLTISIDTQTITANFASSDGWNAVPTRKRLDP